MKRACVVLLALAVLAGCAPAAPAPTPEPTPEMQISEPGRVYADWSKRTPTSLPPRRAHASRPGRSRSSSRPTPTACSSRMWESLLTRMTGWQDSIADTAL